ncbi:MAG TPA: hypothetical protein VK981_16200 [Ramlibacter sp.]|nr:hypothetical protein [Ramlibacter sp.]
MAAALLGAAWLAGAASTVLWCLQPGTSGWRLLAAAAALALAGGAAAWHWWSSPVGTLAWDGEAWTWAAGAGQEAGELDVALDLQRCLLLHWRSGAAARWFWVERSHSVQRWGDLRRAVYSRARAQVLRQAEPPAAKT